MTPAQLSVLASVHAVANGARETVSEATTMQGEGTVGDLMAFASMRQR